MKVTTPEEFRAARAARIEAERLAVERERTARVASAKATVEEFDKRLAAGDDVFRRGVASIGSMSEGVASLVAATLLNAGWTVKSEEETDDFSMDHGPYWCVTVYEKSGA